MKETLNAQDFEGIYLEAPCEVVFLENSWYCVSSLCLFLLCPFYLCINIILMDCKVYPTALNSSISSKQKVILTILSRISYHIVKMTGKPKIPGFRGGNNLNVPLPVFCNKPNYFLEAESLQ